MVSDKLGKDANKTNLEEYFQACKETSISGFYQLNEECMQDSVAHADLTYMFLLGFFNAMNYSFTFIVGFNVALRTFLTNRPLSFSLRLVRVQLGTRKSLNPNPRSWLGLSSFRCRPALSTPTINSAHQHRDFTTFCLMKSSQRSDPSSVSWKNL